MEAEMGDLFFSLVNICRYLDINPERALNTTTDKFAKRFRYIENKPGSRKGPAQHEP